MPPSHQRAQINEALYAIHRDIAAPLTAKSLAEVAAYSEQHFHRVFHKVVGETVNQYIRRTRLEHAANQLMFDKQSPILDIAEKCGFVSLSSFGHAFKDYFGVTPGYWRSDHSSSQSPSYFTDVDISEGFRRISSLPLPSPELVQLPDRNVAYVRHQGYGRDIRRAWHTLRAWATAEQRSMSQQFGIHHSNPTWVPLEKCRYVACIEIETPLVRRGPVSSLTIPSGLHAVFPLNGRYGDLLPFINKILEEWLPQSGFKMQTTPAYVHYQKNQFFSLDEHFELTFNLPITII